MPKGSTARNIAHRNAALLVRQTGLKTCPDCATEKPIEAFHRSKRNLDGRHTYCTPCDSKRSLNWARAHPHAHLNIRRKYRYGMTVVGWFEMFDLQGKVCAICKADKPGGKAWWHTDHCHKTGRVRGILCIHCNRLLGGAQDDVQILEAATAYLRASRNDL
jgi:hypothetical protein